MAGSFSSTERFRVTMVDADGSSSRVTVQLSLEGLKVLSGDGSRTMRSYNLRNVSSWDLMDTSTVIWTKSEVDLEERALTLSGDSTTIRNVVDTLASCCMQLAEVIRDKEEGRHLEELAAGGGKTKKAAKLPSVDSVEYWRGADKSGWLQAQSDVMKMWRRRWFVLKQGYLFRFLSPDVSESVKPRGVVDLSKVQDVRDGRSVTGKANTLQLKTASGGSVCYVCESETEMVEWISALEGAIARIVKQLAGVDDGSSGGSKGSSRDRHRSSSARDRPAGGSSSDWAKQVERSLSQGAGGSSSRRGGGGGTMVSVVGYGNGLSGSSSGGNYRASAPPAGGGSAYDHAGITDYSQVAGIAGVASALDDLSLNYGGYGGGGAAPAAGGPGSYSYASGGGPSYASTPYGSAPAAAGPYSSYGAPPAAAGYGSSSGPPLPAYGGDPSLGGSSGSYGYAAAAAAPGGGYDAAPPANGGYGGASYGQPQQQQYAAPSSGGYGAAAGYYQQQQPQQQQQQPLQPAPSPVSLIDQVPTQQPAYPYYQYAAQQAGQQDAAPAPAAAPPAAAPPAAAPPAAAVPPPAAPLAASTWQVHHTSEGRAYYYDTASGTTQWEPPANM